LIQAVRREGGEMRLETGGFFGLKEALRRFEGSEGGRVGGVLGRRVGGEG